MKNAFKSSQSKSKNFVKRVLSKTNSLNASDLALNNAVQMDEEKPPINVEMELFSLKKQIDCLQKSVNAMQFDNEKKEASLAKLARDKEQLHVDLNKQRRSNTNLKQQLEDERKFYYKEKEQYCVEMNETKKLKQKLGTNSDYNLKEVFRQKEILLKSESEDLKERVRVTLEANYNLSVKFLRMKNTKFCLKNRLKRLQIDHNSAMEEFRRKLEKVEEELAEIVSKEFLSPITPSCKKYLQLIKYNGQLIHENLALHQQTERLQLQLDKIKMQQVREETNSKLQYYKKRSRSGGTSAGRLSKAEKNKNVDFDLAGQRANSTFGDFVESEVVKENNSTIGSKNSKSPSKEVRLSPTTALPLLDIQTLYERKKPSTPTSSGGPLLKQPIPTSRRLRATSSAKERSPSSSSSITIQPLDNSKPVTLPADVAPSCTNLRLLCRSENEGGSSESGSNFGEVGGDSSSYGRGLSSTTSGGGVGENGVVSSVDLLQVSNCTSIQNTEMSFYTSVYNESRPQSAPAAGSRGTNTKND